MSTPRKTLIGSLFGLLVITAAGCPSGEKPPEKTPEGALPRASVTLRVAVVSDANLRAAIDRLRGEWNELTSGTVETVAVDRWDDDTKAAYGADLIVFPSRTIGTLCEAGAIRPVRSSVLKSESLRFEDFLPLVRDQEIVYAQEVMALPLGCPTPLHLLPDSGLAATKLPDDDLQLALAYLAWAAPRAVHRSRSAALFEAETLRPRLAEAPFVRALEGFVASHAEEAGGRVVWPRRDELLAEGFSPQLMPAAEEVFDPIAEQWEPALNGERHATLLASSGRLIAVTKASRNAATAFRYAAWLVGPENSRQISTVSDRVAVCRGSLARSGDAWRQTEDRQLAKVFSATVAEALRQPRFLFVPRLPGSDEYLAALAGHVRAALDGTPAAEALAQAAADWEAITNRYGRQDQAAAYRRSINNAGFPSKR